MMKTKNPIEESQKLENDLEYEIMRRKNAEKEIIKLRKEITELKKNLDNF